MRRHNIAAGCLLLFLAFVPLGATQAKSPRRLNKDGIKAYKEGEFGKALDRFRRAAESAPDALLLDYNAGAARAATETYPDALTDFSKAGEARDADLADNARFAQGVVHYRLAQQKADQGDLEAALQDAQTAARFNRLALRCNPAATDARMNYELARRLEETIKEQIQQQQQQQNQEQQKQDEKKEDQQNQEQQKQDEKKEDKQDQQQQESDQNKSEDQRDKKDKQSQEQKNQEENQEQQRPDQQTPERTPTPRPEPGEERKEEERSKPEDQAQASQQNAEQAEASDEEQGQDATVSLLNLLNENDVDALKRMLRLRYGRMPQPEKDW
jgi:Ca-activated chloride channel family protein